LILWQRSAHTADGTPLFTRVLDPALFVAALALAPARRAAGLDPAVAIRG